MQMKATVACLVDTQIRAKKCTFSVVVTIYIVKTNITKVAQKKPKKIIKGKYWHLGLDIDLLLFFLVPVVGGGGGVFVMLLYCLKRFSLCDFVKNRFFLFFGYLHVALIIAASLCFSINETRHSKAK
ncbi:hypothetical protein L873DRAFT_809655 [Choiromyces venosus 120613-1]|uniref:Uncharacterized protein n=1 Tax=Choiromyces venosus 120613-1 TaxID=1336337 RepID=A0A3N4K375_9PEZI|nr:hypothetical protein L873DRAFT_809655 [Choiromyces venosus 120613-1]